MPTDEEINKVLAEKVMGWKPSDYWLMDMWTPLTDIAQAMMCANALAEKDFNINIKIFPSSASCMVVKITDMGGVMHTAAEPAEAISRACYEAVKEG